MSKNISATEMLSLHKKKDFYKKIILTVLMVLLGVINVFPFIFTLSSSFKPLNEIFVYPIKLIPDTFIWSNYTSLLSKEYNFMRWYGNTILRVTLTISMKFFIVSLTAYVFAKMQFKGKNVIFLTLLSSMMIPPEAMIIPKYIIFKNIHITNTIWSVVLPGVFDSYFVFMLRQFFMSIPDSLSEAGIIDGCGHFRIYSKIVLPLAKPAIVTMVLFTFIWGWNDYMNPYIFITDTNKQMLSVGIKLFQSGYSTNYGMQMAAAMLVLLPVLLVFLFTQKYFVEGVATSGMKG